MNEPIENERVDDSNLMIGIDKDSKKTNSDYNDVPDQRKNFVQSLLDDVENAELYFADDFAQMERNEYIVKHGRNERTPRNFYVSNICQRHVHSKTSELYARNPTIEAKPKDRMRYEIYDGNPDTIQQAVTEFVTAQQEGRPPQPGTTELLQDYERGRSRENVIKRIGKTMELGCTYFMKECDPPFKDQLKKTVKRTITNFVGYVELDFQRDMVGDDISIQSDIDDHRQRIAHIEHLTKEVSEGENIHEGDSELEELRLALKALEAQEEITLREGLTFGFPASNSIIIDPNCTQIKGFVGADWICKKILMSPLKASTVYKMDIGEAGAEVFSKQRDDAEDETATGAKAQEYIKVYRIYHKITGLVYDITPGFHDFLSEPAPPNVTLQRFWPIYVLAPNDIENQNSIYGSSDIQLITPMQNEINSARQGFREHRLASRPKYGVGKGMLSQEDLEQLANHPANAILQLQGLQGSQKIQDVLQPIPTIGVDQNLYQTNQFQEDVTQVTGQSEAARGGTNAGVSATQTSVAQSASSATIESHTDELDDFLSEIFRGCGEIMLREMSLEQMKRIVGVGAVWPELTNSDIQEELELGILGGSSGKRNAAAELGKLERVSQFILQIPGFKPKAFAKDLLDELDSKKNIDDYFEDGLPSMVAQNQNAQMATADPAANPNMQGGRQALPSPQQAGNGSLA